MLRTCSNPVTQKGLLTKSAFLESVTRTLNDKIIRKSGGNEGRDKWKNKIKRYRSDMSGHEFFLTFHTRPLYHCK